MIIIEKKADALFLSIEKINELAALCEINEPFRPLFYDIETTGLSRKTSFLYLIGTICYQNDTWMLRQWFAEKPEEEVLLLQNFLAFAENFSHTIQYNGNHFDAPYLRERCSLYGLVSPIDALPALDLYQFLKPLKGLLKLNHMRQSDIEQFLQLPDRTSPDGKACIRHYKQYLSKKQEDDLLICLSHNEEDLLGMGHIFSMFAYQGLISKAWGYQSISFDDDEIVFHLKLQHPVPIPVSGGIPGLYLLAEKNILKLLVRVKNRKLQQFYLNYKDYDYLPGEDTAIPKSLGVYMDKSLKKAATLETCYTWFPVTELFLSSREQQMQYLNHTIPYLLKMLSS